MEYQKMYHLKIIILSWDMQEWGFLRQNLGSVSQVNWMDKLTLLHCITSDLQMIHSQGLIHRDLHSGNILQDNLHSAYISDLELSITTNFRTLNMERRGVYGILPYIAPEVLDGEQYTTASDIYSFGIIMWEIYMENPSGDSDGSYKSKFIEFTTSFYQDSDLNKLIVENLQIMN
ncbi:kinase-like domain-containing protein [Gigaspora rosea]|uniref:Kinase-like domain-containing protein n=1 Tax=Gigaspora rosea TaxID=44941 RepID=A0A397TTT2_9GLOM|nr:kinase-like domain-containing protein [Gigaspora rosea]